MSLINEAIRAVLSEAPNIGQRSARPLPDYMQRRQDEREAMRSERIAQNFAYTQAKKQMGYDARLERDLIRMQDQQDMWRDKRYRIPYDETDPNFVGPPSDLAPPKTPPQKPPYNPDTAPPLPGSNIPPAPPPDHDKDQDGTPDNIQRPNEPPPPPNFVEDPNKGPVGLGGTEGDPAFDAYRKAFEVGHPGDKKQPPPTPPSNKNGQGLPPGSNVPPQGPDYDQDQDGTPDNIQRPNENENRYYTANPMAKDRPQSVMAVANQLSKMAGPSPLRSRPIQNRMA